MSTIVIVGASSGIGRAAAALFAGRGDRVVMASRSQAKLEEAARVIGGNTHPAPMDMLDRATVARVLGGIQTIDHLVLTAVDNELFSQSSIATLSVEQVERTFDKLRGFVNVIGAAAPRLRGSLTLVTGASAVKPPADGFSVLAAASASLLGFGKALALELAPVRVNVVMSGVVDTAIHAARRTQMKTWAETTLPARRFGEPEDLAKAIALLVDNPYITGSTLTVDGGLTAL